METMWTKTLRVWTKPKNTFHGERFVTRNIAANFLGGKGRYLLRYFFSQFSALHGHPTLGHSKKQAAMPTEKQSVVYILHGFKIFQTMLAQSYQIWQSQQPHWHKHGEFEYNRNNLSKEGH